MHKRLRTALALGAASLLVVAACGGDDDEASADSGGDSTISIVGLAVPGWRPATSSCSSR